MYQPSENEKRLHRLLKELPFNGEELIPNDRENGIICTMITAVNDNAVDEYIKIIEENPDKDYDEIMSLLLPDSRVEITDGVDDE